MRAPGDDRCAPGSVAGVPSCVALTARVCFELTPNLSVKAGLSGHCGRVAAPNHPPSPRSSRPPAFPPAPLCPCVPRPARRRPQHHRPSLGDLRGRPGLQDGRRRPGPQRSHRCGRDVQMPGPSAGLGAGPAAGLRLRFPELPWRSRHRWDGGAQDPGRSRVRGPTLGRRPSRVWGSICARRVPPGLANALEGRLAGAAGCTSSAVPLGCAFRRRSGSPLRRPPPLSALSPSPPPAPRVPPGGAFPLTADALRPISPILPLRICPGRGRGAGVPFKGFLSLRRRLLDLGPGKRALWARRRADAVPPRPRSPGSGWGVGVAASRRAPRLPRSRACPSPGCASRGSARA